MHVPATKLYVGAYNPSDAQLGYLSGMNQALDTTASPTFATVSSNNIAGLSGSSMKITPGSGQALLFKGSSGTIGTFSSGGQLNININIPSTSTTTGTLTCGGGVGIAGDTYIGGSLNSATVKAPTATNLTLKLGDDVGVNKLNITNNSGAVVASIDSLGSISGNTMSTNVNYKDSNYHEFVDDFDGEFVNNIWTKTTTGGGAIELGNEPSSLILSANTGAATLSWNIKETLNPLNKHTILMTRLKHTALGPDTVIYFGFTCNSNARYFLIQIDNVSSNHQVRYLGGVNITDTVSEMNILPRAVLANTYVYWKIEFDATNIYIHSRVSYKDPWVLNHQVAQSTYFDVDDHITNFAVAGPKLFITGTAFKYVNFDFIKIYSDRE